MFTACSLKSLPYELVRRWCNGSEWAEFSLVVEIKENQDSDPIFLELKRVIHNQKVEVFS